MSYSLDGSNPAILELQKEVRYTRQALFKATKMLASSDLVMADIGTRLGEAQERSPPSCNGAAVHQYPRQYEMGEQFQLLLKASRGGDIRASTSRH